MLVMVLLLLGAVFYKDMTAAPVVNEPRKLELPSSPVILNLSKADAYEQPHTGDAFMLIQKRSALDLSNLVDGVNIEKTLGALTKTIGSRQLGSRGNLAARRYIVSELQTLGFSETSKTLVRQGFSASGVSTENIVAAIAADNPEAPIVLIGAHFDTVSGVEGAIDNASGVASLLEAARVIKECGLTFEFEIRFCFFSAEENGYFGAYHYLSKLDKHSLSRHAAFFNVDMAGCGVNDAEHVLVVCTKGSPNGAEPADPNVISRSAEKAHRILPLRAYELFSPMNTGKHDIVPFVKNGVYSATFSWREIDYARAADNSFGLAAPAFMHTSNDSLENIDVGSVELMTRFIVASFSIVADHVELRVIP